MAAVTAYGFLHTAAVHVDRFDALVAELSPGDDALHRVDPDLLAAARRGTDGAVVAAAVGAHLDTLAADGAARVLCTCSTLAETAHRVGADHGIDVVRVDRPMAAAAVRLGRRIAVVAALDSTVGPTRALLEDEAQRAGRPVTLVDAPCFAAWNHFEAGDLDRYLAGVAACVEGLDDEVDVIVLAQASMAPVETLVTVGVPVLSSPRPAVAELVRLDPDP